jgi:hypothetical protein
VQSQVAAIPRPFISILFNAMKASEMNALERFSIFLQSARDYCDFIESAGRYSEVAFFEYAQKHLITLYINVQSLELVEVIFDADFSPLLTKESI